MSLIAFFKARFMDSSVAAFWHRVTPHLTVHRWMDGQKVYFDLNDNIDDLTRPSFLSRETMTKWICKEISGTYWDVGCNIGQFAIPAALAGHSVVAFDISPRACRLLQLTVSANALPVTVIDQALSITSFSYTPPSTSRPTEQLGADKLLSTETLSMSLPEAWGKHGPPALVKMDIEGSENDFLTSPEWKKLFLESGFYWLLEVHPPRTNMDALWRDVPCLRLDEHHYLFQRTGEAFEKLRGQWQAT